MSLSKKQLEAAKMIAEGRLTNEEIAQKCEVTDRTLYNWKRQEEFRHAIDDFTTEMKKDIERKLMSMSSKALRELDKLLCARSELVRLQAIKDVLDRLDIKPADKQNIDLKTDMDIVVKLPDELTADKND
jgi:transposase-like protein